MSTVTENLIPTNKVDNLLAGEYYISHDSIVDGIPSEVYAFFHGDKSRCYAYQEPIGKGGLGEVHAYVDIEDKDRSIAVKLTSYHIDTENAEFPSRSHHFTESQAPGRLFSDDSAGKCKKYFVETLQPSSESVNAFTNNHGEEDNSYTIGNENITDLWLAGYTSQTNFKNPRHIGLRLNRFQMFIITVMERAEGSLYRKKLTKKDVQKVLTLVDDMQMCLGTPSIFFYKDIKLDQVLVMPNGDFKLGDLGNLCTIDDECEWGYFDDPELWELKYKSHWNEVEWVYSKAPSNPDEIVRGLRWQRAMFVCELMLATDDHTSDALRVLAPHLWEHKSLKEIVARFDNLRKVVKLKSKKFRKMPYVQAAIRESTTTIDHKKKSWLLKFESHADKIAEVVGEQKAARLKARLAWKGPQAKTHWLDAWS